MSNSSYLVVRTPEGDVPVKDLESLKKLLEGAIITDKGVTITKTVEVSPPVKDESAMSAQESTSMDLNNCYRSKVVSVIIAAILSVSIVLLVQFLIRKSMESGN